MTTEFAKGVEIGLGTGVRGVVVYESSRESALANGAKLIDRAISSHEGNADILVFSNSDSPLEEFTDVFSVLKGRRAEIINMGPNPNNKLKSEWIELDTGLNYIPDKDKYFANVDFVIGLGEGQIEGISDLLHIGGVLITIDEKGTVRKYLKGKDNKLEELLLV